MKNRALAALTAAAAIAASTAHAQSKAQPATEATQMATGWTALNQGDANRAMSIAGAVLGQNPRSRPGVVLLVTAAVARGGSADGLTVYEQWLGARKLDDAYTLRTVALALLREAARNRAASAAQQEAIKALTAEGDAEVLLAVVQSSTLGAQFETELSAQLGSEPAVKALIAQLTSGRADRLRVIDALANSRSPLAVRPLVGLLKDPNPDVRAACADALGKLSATDSVESIRPLLDDQVFSVRFAAASALLRLRDTSGLGFLRQLEASEHAMVRVGALEAMSVDPGQAWVSSVLPLLRDPDPQVRLVAARLAAAYDPAAVQKVIEELMSDPNPAIREAAAKIFVEQVAGDFAVLRRLLRSADPLVRVRAAGRILSLTR